MIRIAMLSHATPNITPPMAEHWSHKTSNAAHHAVCVLTAERSTAKSSHQPNLTLTQSTGEGLESCAWNIACRSGSTSSSSTSSIPANPDLAPPPPPRPPDPVAPGAVAGPPPPCAVGVLAEPPAEADVAAEEEEPPGYGLLLLLFLGVMVVGCF